MPDDPHSRGGPPTYVQPGTTAPTHGERTRTLVASADTGTLSTLALDPSGHPFGSVVTYALAPDGAPLVLMSTMAEHARNLDADPRCSLLVAAPEGEGAGRLAAARATLVGSMVRLPDAEQDDATARYLQAHPGAFWARFPDFAVHRLDVVAIRYVRGFGEMSWVDPTGYTDAEPDPVAPAEAGIVAHMNDDHADAMRAMVDHLLDVEGDVVDVTMLSCDRYGFEVELTLEPTSPGDAPGLAFGRVGFRRPLTRAADARGAMVELVDSLPA